MPWFLALVLTAFSVTSAAAELVALYVQPDGLIVSYEPQSRVREGNWATIYFEVAHPKPFGCTEKGCTIRERWHAKYDCSNFRWARLGAESYDPSGKLLASSQWKPSVVVIEDNDEASRALYAAACARTTKRRQG
jgi:hypothetical protein